MVLPVLGLLGLAAGSMALPHVQNYQSKTRGNYGAGLLEDVDREDPAAVSEALFGGGLLNAPQYAGDVRSGFEGVQDRAAAMARQRVSSGPAYMNAQLQREKWETGTQNPNSPNYIDPFNQWQRQQAYNAENPSLAEQTASRRLALAEREFDAEQGAAALERAQMMAVEDDTYIGARQEVEDDLAAVGSAIDNLDDASFDLAFWSDTAGLRLRNTINQQIFAQRMQYVRENYGEAEPPPAVMEQISEMFPLIDNDGVLAREGQARDTVLQNLLRYRSDLMNRAENMSGSFSRVRGRTPPQVFPQNVLPEGVGQ